jgi:uncharacterized protein
MDAVCQHGQMHPSRSIPLCLLALGAAGLGYAAGYEVRSFRLRRIEVPVLPADQQPLRVLHISDIHLTPGQHKKLDWLRSLAALQPDLVVNTGDNIAHRSAVEPLLDALDELLERPGVFVLGSNDYFAPRPRNPVRYLLPDDRSRNLTKPLPWEDLRDGFTKAGWTDLTNRRARLDADGREIEFVGVDDPHIWRDRYDEVAGPVDVGADLAIGVTHSPEPRVLRQMAADGCALLLAGHTHGGQLRVPGYGAIVTNCGLDPGRARGLSRYGDAWLHVSAGLGTSPYAPVRFACPPEATLLTLTAITS